jgi:predicted TIM-barrel fold metal-dependent hydrolase
MRIDFHTHAHPDNSADAAMKAAEHFLRLKSLWPMTIAGLHKQMNSSQVDKCVVLCVTDSPAHLKETNDWAIEIQSDRIIPFGTLHPDYKDCAEEVHRLRSEGLKGIKLHCGANRFRPDDKRLFPAYEEMGDDMVVLIHAGALQFSADDAVNGAPHRIARVRKEFPRLKIVAAH